VANYQFGAGKVSVRPYTSNGVLGSPIELATLQDASIEFKVATKKLYGAYRFPVAVADGEGEIPFTCKAAVFSGSAFNLVLNGVSASGGRTIVNDEMGVVAAGTYTVAQTATFQLNTSIVWYTPPGGGLTKQLAIVASGPVAGVSYTEGAGGVLTFATGDNGATIRVTYLVSVSSGGQAITLSNVLQNSSLGAQVTLMETSLNRTNNKQSTSVLQLNQVILPSIKLDFKVGDFTIPDYVMDVSADQNNQIGMLYLTNYDV
jgi:hypothetical protein